MDEEIPDYPSNQPPTFASIVTEDLGYCCVAAFFARNQNTARIAERTGIARRNIKGKKALWKQGQFVCKNTEGCLKKCGLKV